MPFADASTFEKPGAVIPLAGICAGAPGNGLSYRDGSILLKFSRVGLREI